MAVLSIPGVLLSSLIYFLVFTILTCFAIYHHVYFRQIVQWQKSNIPFLQPTFLIGHKYILGLTKHSWMVAFHRIYEENPDKDVVAFFMGTIPLILLRDPKLIRLIFKDNFNKFFVTGFCTLESEVEAQHMINFTANKATWKFSRAVLTPDLAPSQIGGARFLKIKKQIDKLWYYAKKAELNNQPVNLTKVTDNFVHDVVSLWGFGVECNSYEKKGILYKISDRFSEPPIRLATVVYFMNQLPFLQNFKPFKFMPPESCAEMEELLRRKFEHRDRLDVNEDDCVDRLRCLRNEHVVEEEEDGMNVRHKDVSMRQMVGIGLSRLIASVDQVRQLSTFTLHLLSLHPEYQDKVRDEIHEVMKKHKVQEFEYSVIQDLQFTRQCLYETARLYPVLPIIMRHCSEDFQSPRTNHLFKKGDMVVVSPYSIHRDPKFFPDPNKFDPDRFSPANVNSIPLETYLTFGMGPRGCPGKEQGISLSLINIAALIHKYEIKPRSHLKQMDANDFLRFCILNRPERDVIVDIIPCKEVAFS